MRRSFPLVLVSCALLAAGCGEEEDGAGAGGRVQVVATTGVLADLARSVGGDDVEVTTLVPSGADPHDHEPRPSEVAALADADVVLKSGGDLDEWLDDAIEASGTAAPVTTLLDEVPVRRRDGGAVDPHWWQDPVNGRAGAEAIGKAVAARSGDAAARDRVTAGAARYARELGELDGAIRSCVDRVPADRRRIVTTHDALGYYADRFGIEVVGAVIPSLSTQAQASAGETAALVQAIRREGATAVFAEAGVSAKVERAIARESGARVGDELHADALGPEGSAAATYRGSLVHNTRAFVEGFGADPARCALPRA